MRKQKKDKPLTIIAAYLLLRELEVELSALIKHSNYADPELLLTDVQQVRRSIEPHIPTEITTNVRTTPGNI